MKNIIIKSILITLTLFFSDGFSQEPLKSSRYGKQIQKYLDQKNIKKNSVDFKDLYLDSESFSKKSKITHLYVGQSFQGIKIKNAISNFAIKDGKIVYFGNSFINNIAEKVNTTIPIITPNEAVQKHTKHFNLGRGKEPKLVSSKNNKYIFSKADISDKAIPVNLIFVETEAGKLKLAWNVNVNTLDHKHNWSARVDAVTGDILEYNDLILHCDFGKPNNSKAVNNINNKHFNLFKSNNSIMLSGTYNVYALPIESPNHGAIQSISATENLTASPYGWHDTNGSPGEEYTITRGNNVWAQEDIDGNDGIGYSPDGGLGLSFNYTHDINEPDPAVYQDAAITNLFYMNNMMHDIWHVYGFDEASGNFQENNYGNGGIEGDYVIADAQDSSDSNNASFFTPSDGNSPRMQMHLFNINGAGVSISTLMVNTPVGISGNYTVSSGSFGESTYNITGNLVLVDDGTALPNEGCNTLINDTELSGNIAVIYRGNCEFGTKVLNAQNAGAIAAIVINNVAGEPITMGPGADGSSVTIPAVMISQSDGVTITDQLPGVNVTLQGEPNISQLDSNFDNSVVAHEYGHGISTRLVGGPQYNCLFGNEQMGEGWSDWFALMVTIEPGDLAENARGIGTYTANQPITGIGIRRYPYSTDFGINPFTYDDIKTEAVPHGVGSVWGTMLWDLTWAYIDKYGLDLDLYNGTGGNNKVMYLVIEALKLQNCSPGFIDARNAIIAADELLYNGEDKCLIWNVFAARGLGFSASQGDSTSNTDGTEAFDLPPFFTNAKIENTTPINTVTEGETVTFFIETSSQCIDLTNVAISDELMNNTLDYVNNSASNGGSFSNGIVSYPLVDNLTTGTSVNYNYQATVKSGSYYSPVTLFDDDFSTETNWDATGTGAGNWSITTPGSCSNSSSYFCSNAALSFESYLTTVNSYTPSGLLTISIDHSYNTEENWDGGVIEFSIDNGVTWNDLSPYIVQNNYNGSIASPSGTILSSRKAFTGNSQGCVTTIAKLCGFIGESVQLRFLFAEDSNTAAEGWNISRVTFVDEAAVYTRSKSVVGGVEETSEFCLLINPTLSTDQNKEFKSLEVFPNPTNGMLTIQSATSLKNAKIEIYDIMGRVLSAKQTVNINNSLSINISNYASGTYFLIIKDKTHKSTKTIIKS